MTQLEQARWRALETRDAGLTGLFVYAVRTTGVYCRPGCASRRPLARNVEYFDTTDDAVAAGYRACRRCRPDRDHEVDDTTKALIAACRLFETTSDESVADVAREVGLSERHLRRLFSDVVGVPAGRYRSAAMAARLRAALQDGQSVTDAAIASGYGSLRGLYEDGASRLGMTPGAYRRGGRGELLRYTSIETPVGVVVAASTNRGVCSVRVGAREAELTKALAAEYPHAIIERDDTAMAGVARTLAAATRGGDATSLPVDVRGTAFQVRVWEALRMIPRGETRTYSEVADGIGEPRAVRAVASACAANSAALAIPCHRVIRKDGSLGGYRWGLDVKAALLAAEADL